MGDKRDKRLDNRPTAPHEQELINIGHHLWRQRKEWQEPGISLALQAAWDAKEAVRVTLRREWLESLASRYSGLSKARLARGNGKVEDRRPRFQPASRKETNSFRTSGYPVLTVRYA